jgi:hypothetical protein
MILDAAGVELAFVSVVSMSMTGIRGSGVVHLRK